MHITRLRATSLQRLRPFFFQTVSKWNVWGGWLLQASVDRKALVAQLGPGSKGSLRDKVRLLLIHVLCSPKAEVDEDLQAMLQALEVLPAVSQQDFFEIVFSRRKVLSRKERKVVIRLLPAPRVSNWKRILALWNLWSNSCSSPALTRVQLFCVSQKLKFMFVCYFPWADFGTVSTGSDSNKKANKSKSMFGQLADSVT